jgi:AraC-like DNA-binding protein
MYDAGFGSKSSFQREFQKRFGMSPSAYRAAWRNASNTDD